MDRKLSLAMPNFELQTQSSRLVEPRHGLPNNHDPWSASLSLYTAAHHGQPKLLLVPEHLPILCIPPSLIPQAVIYPLVMPHQI